MANFSLLTFAASRLICICVVILRQDRFQGMQVLVLESELVWFIWAPSVYSCKLKFSVLKLNSWFLETTREISVYKILMLTTVTSSSVSRCECTCIGVFLRNLEWSNWQEGEQGDIFRWE